MIQMRAIVIQLDGKNALVESTQGGGCGNCDTQNGCSSSKLSQLFCSEPRRFRVRNDGNAQPGTLVQVTVPEGVLLHSALLMYILPLAFMLLGAVSGRQLANDLSYNDVYSAAGSFVGLVSGFLLVKGLSMRSRVYSSAQPVILSSMNADSAIN